MGMRVGGATSSAAMSAWQARRQDFGNLVSAVKNGNLSGAQQAFAALSALNPASAGTSTGGSTTSATSSANATNGGLAAVGQALSSGDIAAAQKALTDMFANGTGGHHHHHGGQGAANSASTTVTPASTPSAGSTYSTMA